MKIWLVKSSGSRGRYLAAVCSTERKALNAARRCRDQRPREIFWTEGPFTLDVPLPAPLSGYRPLPIRAIHHATH